ncbi:MAG: PadR family transcriptional regulator [Mariniblastus sp.]
MKSGSFSQGNPVDAEDAKKSLQKQLNSGASALVLLAMLERQNRPMYGYEVAKELERQNGGSLPMNPGALYPVLRSLEKQGLLQSETELSEEGRARRYYSMTKVGMETFRHWRQAWADTKQFVDTILENKDDQTSRKRDASLPKKPRKSTR